MREHPRGARTQTKQRKRSVWVMGRQMWWDLGLTGKTDRKKGNCVLRGFGKALKPEERCTEDTQERTVQVKMIKPAPGWELSPRVRRVYFSPAKGYASDGDSLPRQEFP